MDMPLENGRELQGLEGLNLLGTILISLCIAGILIAVCCVIACVSGCAVLGSRARQGRQERVVVQQMIPVQGPDGQIMYQPAPASASSKHTTVAKWAASNVGFR